MSTEHRVRVQAGVPHELRVLSDGKLEKSPTGCWRVTWREAAEIVVGPPRTYSYEGEDVEAVQILEGAYVGMFLILIYAPGIAAQIK